MQSPVNFTAGHLEGMNIITGGEIPVNAETLALFTAHTFNLGDAWTLEAALRWQQTDGFRQSDINGLGFHQEERITLQNAEGTFKFPITHMGATLVTMGTAVETDVDGEVTMPAITVAQTDPSFVAQATALATVQATLEDIVDGTKRNTLAQANIVGIPLAYQHPEDDAVTGSLSLRWDINDSLTGHVAYNRSYRVGGISVNPGDAPGVENQLYDGETADSVELGVRMLIGGRAEFNLVGYYQLFDGYQGFIRELTYLGVNPATRMPAVQSLSGGLVFNGDMVSTGIDFDWRMLLAESLTLGGTLNWNQSEFDGANVPCNDREAGEIVGYCESSDRIPGSPELQASLFLEWVLNLRQAQFFIRSNNKFSDGILSTRAVGKDDTRPTETGSYTLSDLFIGLRSLNDIWEVSAYAKNLADERTATDLRNPGGGSGTSGNFDPAGYFTEIRRLPPRTYGLRLRYNF